MTVRIRVRTEQGIKTYKYPDSPVGDLYGTKSLTPEQQKEYDEKVVPKFRVAGAEFDIKKETQRRRR